MTLGKIHIQLDNSYASRFRGAGKMTRLRGQLNTVDPRNLNQIILAEG